MQGATALETADEFALDELDEEAQSASDPLKDSGLADVPGQILTVPLGDGGSGGFVDVATLPYVTQEPNSIEGQFFDGYRAAGGQDEARIDAMIFCESSWRLDPGGWHLGLAQFDPGTWATVSAITGYTDPYNAYHQGFNVAVWALMISPGTSAGWPNCW